MSQSLRTVNPMREDVTLAKGLSLPATPMVIGAELPSGLCPEAFPMARVVGGFDTLQVGHNPAFGPGRSTPRSAA